MNLESTSSKKPNAVVANDEIDFDFKPITSGLGFHSQKTTEIKPAFTDRPMNIQAPVAAPVTRKENTVYQNDLSLFYGKELTPPIPVAEVKEEKVYRPASKPQRMTAYLLDLGFILSCLGLVLTVMSRSISMDLMEVWQTYPNEITPLVATLFCGFYLIYFSIFEKTTSSTLGKSILGITVVNTENKPQSFSQLLLRSVITLLNFGSLGLFSYFDLQNKISQSKVIKAE